MGKKTAANKLSELGLTSNYNKYTLERARMGRCVAENSPAKAFSQFETASYRDLITEPRGLAYIIAVMPNLGVKVSNRQI